MHASAFKYRLYVALSVLLGLMISMLLHSAIEIPVLRFIVSSGSSPEQFFAGYWHEVHMFFGTTLSVVCAVTGFVLGRRGWYQVYIEERFGKPHW